jgi:D-glucuronyl C5-epimerase C-terminus
LPVGPRITPGELGGYYIDFRAKAETPRWPPDWWVEGATNHVVAAQWGLGAFERHLGGEGEGWLDAAVAVTEHLLARQREDGGWPHERPMRHTYRMQVPWLSAMAQGEVASLAVRVYDATGDERFAQAGRRALEPMSVAVADGGVRARLGSGFFLEEYPTDPPSLVLNGGIFALWGYYDVAVALGDDASRREFDAGVRTLAANIDRWDTGSWSRYDLVDRAVTNVASGFYHALHIDQLRALHLIAPHDALAAAADRFDRYRASRARRVAALGRKALFRVLVPRHSLLAHRTPFARSRSSAERPAGDAGS